FILSIPENKLTCSYEKGKWTIKEVISHLIDMERVYMYRALRFSRNDQTILPGFDADRYVQFSGANERDLAGLLEEFKATRNSTIQFLNGLTDDAILRTGNVKKGSASVRSLAYHIAGHELHHINIVKERYL
ncbi:MAG TPA: DinB family protein, partial [Flavisolibacter sp.]|nr:DinB family protein [Flavisolibacter sp.]